MCGRYSLRRPLHGTVNAVFLNEVFRDVVGVVAQCGPACRSAFIPTALFRCGAQAYLLCQLATLGSIIRRCHRVVARQLPLIPILLAGNTLIGDRPSLSSLRRLGVQASWPRRIVRFQGREVCHATIEGGRDGRGWGGATRDPGRLVGTARRRNDLQSAVLNPPFSGKRQTSIPLAG